MNGLRKQDAGDDRGSLYRYLNSICREQGIEKPEDSNSMKNRVFDN
jgi:hypothetical protein